MSSSRPTKIAYISWIAPHEKSGGGPLAMHRHFVLHDDFDLLVISSGIVSEAITKVIVPPRLKALARLSNTRLSRLIRQFQILWEPYYWSRRVVAEVQAHGAEAVFTVADPVDSWGAYLIARRLQLPLVVNFQDWWPTANFHCHHERPYPLVRAIIAKRFRILYEKASCVFFTSEGFRDFLGERENSHVLYPTGPPRDENFDPELFRKSQTIPLKLGYAGQIPIESYGKFLVQMADELDKDSRNFALKVFGSPKGTGQETAERLARLGVYGGFLNQEELQKELEACDVLIAIMGVDERCPIWMKTSFTTKILDYARLGKPIFIWGPENCAPVRLAEKTGYALTYSGNDVKSALDTLSQLSDPGNYERFARSSWEAGTTFLDHGNLHATLVNGIKQAVR